MSDQNGWQQPALEPVASAQPMALDAGELPDAVPQQGFARAAGAGFLAAIVGAIAWAGITFTTKMQIGFMAIGIGVVVALAVRRFGNQTMQHAVLSAGLALFGCVLGNLLSTCAFYADSHSMPVLQVVRLVLGQPEVTVRLLTETFQPMDALFYAIATYEGFKLVIRGR